MPRTLACLGLLVSLLLTGCGDAFIDPFNNDARYYTVYGFLDLLETQHTLRVIPVTRRAEHIESPAGAFIDAKVTTTDMTTDVTTEWTHSVERLEDGLYGHVYRARFIVWPGRTYRLVVERSDGVQATAETTVPVINDPALFERGPYVFSADSSVVTRDLKIPGIASPWDMNAIYLWAAGPINRRVFVPYGRRGTRTEDGGWQTQLTVSADQSVVRDDMEASVENGQIPADLPRVLSAMGLQIRVLDPNWDPPEGVFDPETLAQPNALSNVENGFGFFGSVGLYIEEWNAGELSEALGYAFCGPGC